ncbi:MAG: MBL fold metallo-hydrolase [Thermoanaerobaculia bacterium]
MKVLNDYRSKRAVLIGLTLVSLVSPKSDLAASEVPASRFAGPFVRVLGSVQDGGMPHAACNHALCLKATENPELRLTVASLALIDPSTNQVYLFDATPDIREQLVALADVRAAPVGRVDRAPLAGVFLTHAHIGHYLGLSFFGFEAVSSNNLPVYSTPRMSAYLRSNGPWSQLVEMKNIDLRESPPGKRIEVIPGVGVTPIAVPHRDELSDTVGFLIQGPSRSLFYVPDTDNWAAWSRPIEEVIQDVEIVLLDGTFYSADELPGRSVAEIGHPLITDTMRRLEGLVQEGKKIYFTHLNHSNPGLDPSSAERREIEERGFRIVVEGQEFPL